MPLVITCSPGMSPELEFTAVTIHFERTKHLKHTSNACKLAGNVQLAHWPIVNCDGCLRTKHFASSPAGTPRSMQTREARCSKVVILLIACVC